MFGRPPTTLEDWEKVSWLDPSNRDPAVKVVESSVVAVANIRPVPGQGTVLAVTAVLPRDRNRGVARHVVPSRHQPMTTWHDTSVLATANVSTTATTSYLAFVRPVGPCPRAVDTGFVVTQLRAA